MNHLLASLGIQREYNPALDVVMLSDADGAIWQSDRHLIGTDNYTPYAAPRGTTPVALASGELIGWATSHVSKELHAYYVMPELRVAAYKPGDIIGPETTTILQLAIRRDRAGNTTLIATSRAAVTDARDIVLFRDPPALRTSVQSYGDKVWFELSTETFFQEDSGGIRYNIPRGVIEHYLMIGGHYGQHRNAPAPLHGGAAQSPSGSARAWYAPARSGSKAIATQQAAAHYAQQAGAGAGVKQLGGLTVQQLEELLLQYSEGNKPKLPRADPVVGEVVAWRAWAIANAYTPAPVRIGVGVELTSIYKMEVKWLPNEPLVSKPPTDYGDIGIHAHKTRETLLKYVGEQYSTKLLVLGRVRLWGEVVEGETGYRAEFAQVESLEEILRPKFAGWSEVDWEGTPRHMSLVEESVNNQQLLDKLREVYGVN